MIIKSGSSKCIIFAMFMIYGTVAKSFLGNFLLQAASSLSFSPPDDPNSHVSDFRTHPMSNSRTDRYKVDYADKKTHDEGTEIPMTSTEMPQNRETDQLSWWVNNNGTNKYYKKIGDIIRSARQRISDGFQQLSARFTQPNDQFINFMSADASQNMKTAVNSYGVNNVTETYKKKYLIPLEHINISKINFETEDKIRLLEFSDQIEKNENNNSGAIIQSINDTMQTIEPLQLHNIQESRRNRSIAALTNPQHNFLTGRLQNITRKLNENRNQFRNKTIKAIATLVPLVVLATNRKEYGTGNRMETKHMNESFANSSTVINSGEYISMPPMHFAQLSKKLSNLNLNGKQKVILAFENALNKYAQLVINKRKAPTEEGNSFSNRSEPYEEASENSIDETGDDDNTKNDDDDYQKEYNDISSQFIVGENISDDNGSSRENYSSSAKKMNLQGMEMVGIIIIEVFGSIIGLTWGALNHLRSFFQ